MTIQAITFDVWDTLVIDDSDELKRSQMNLPTKQEERIQKIYDIVSRHQSVTKAEVEKAYSENQMEMNRIWREQFKTISAKDRLRILFEQLKYCPEESLLETLSTYWEEMEYHIPPDPAPHVHKVLTELYGKVRLGIVSDAIITPGRLLRKILEKHDLLRFFDAFSFSDEVGFSKPAPQIFEAILKQWHLKPDQVVHIGDRPYNDILGPKQVGMKAILYTGVRTRKVEQMAPDAVIGDYSQLKEVLQHL